MSTKLNLIIYGSNGRMGRELKRLAANAKKFSILAEVDRGGQGTHKDLKTLKPKKPVVLIDFSTPEAMVAATEWCLQNAVPLVSGTTGLNKACEGKLSAASKKIPILWAPNMSVGILLLKRMLSQLAAAADDFDWQIEETHHRDKKDSPSGTAKMLQSYLEKTLQKTLPPVLATRGGGVFGVHKILGLGDEEVLTIEHQALSRGVFAKGALLAASWLSGQDAGLYHFEDVLTHE